MTSECQVKSLDPSVPSSVLMAKMAGNVYIYNIIKQLLTDVLFDMECY